MSSILSFVCISHVANHIRREILRLDPGNEAELQKKRSTLALEVRYWRKAQLKATPSVETLVVDLDPEIEVEREPLYLPSDFNLQETDQA